MQTELDNAVEIVTLSMQLDRLAGHIDNCLDIRNQRQFDNLAPRWRGMRRRLDGLMANPVRMPEPEYS